MNDLGLADMLAEEPAGAEAEDGPSTLDLGSAEETELDPVFAADAGSLFPDFDDAKLTALQRLIDDRINALYGGDDMDVEAETDSMAEGFEF